MSDDRLRALERRWQETGSDEDELAWDEERARLGLPLRVAVVVLRVQTFNPGLDDEAIRRDHPGERDWERVLGEVLRRPHAPWIALDLSELIYFQDTLAGALVGALGRLREVGGGLALCQVPARSRQVFQLLGLEAAFEFHESLAACFEARGWEARGPGVTVEHLAIM